MIVPLSVSVPFLFSLKSTYPCETTLKETGIDNVENCVGKDYMTKKSLTLCAIKYHTVVLLVLLSITLSIHGMISN